MANYNERRVVSGLATLVMHAPNVGTYTLQGNMLLPSIAAGDSADSQVVATINVNGGSTIYTSMAGAGSFFIFPLVISSANSAINIILSSSTPVDQGLNKIKTTVTLSENT